MAQDQQTPPQNDRSDEEASRGPRHFNSELAKAFEDLAKGERTATALESRLDDIEGHIEQLLASVEQQAKETGGADSGDQNSSPPADLSKPKSSK